MSDLETYYQLQKDSKSQYKKFIKTCSNKTTSRDFFTLSNGVLEPKRRKLHKAIIDKYLAQYPSQTKPYIHFILGSIGSGKTSLKDTVVNQEKIKSFLYINFDELKKQFPEYETLKEVNPKKAAHFVQSESAKLAGNLYRKAIKQKVNIIYEKNIRLNKANDLHLISEIKSVFRKNYSVSLHIVFLDSYQEAWRRVKLRYEKIKRYVSKQDVKDTFNCLFPNLNILLSENFGKDYLLVFWYNGKWNVDFNIPKNTYIIGFISFQKPGGLVGNRFNKDNFIIVNGRDHNNRYYYCGFTPVIPLLPKNVQKQLMQIKH